MGMEENPVDFTVSMDNISLGVLFAASGQFSEERLKVPWPPLPPCQQQTQLVVNYFLPQLVTGRHKLHVFPDFVMELSQSCVYPSILHSVLGLRRYEVRKTNRNPFDQ